MKKRLKGLLALSMVVIMTLAMSTGVVLAAEYEYNSSVGVMALNGTELSAGDIVKAHGSGNSFAVVGTKAGSDVMYPSASDSGVSQIYSNIDHTTPLAPEKYCVYKSDDGEYTIGENDYGYEGFIAYAEILPGHYDKDGVEVGSLYLEQKPIECTIQYSLNTDGMTAKPNGAGIGDTKLDITSYDQIKLADGTYNGQQITLGDWVITGWSTKADWSGEIYGVGEIVSSELFNDVLTAEDHKITLYAVWAKTSEGEPGVAEPIKPQAEPPKDSSPNTGDDFMVIPFILLMILSAGTVVAVKRRNA